MLLKTNRKEKKRLKKMLKKTDGVKRKSPRLKKYTINVKRRLSRSKRFFTTSKKAGQVIKNNPCVTLGWIVRGFDF